MAQIDKIKQNRLDKLEAIKKLGLNPFPSKSKKNHYIGEVLDDFSKLSKSKKKVILAGRIMSIRGHGGATFLDVRDGTGKIQAFLNKNKVKEKNYNFFLNNFDIGDIVEIEGILFKTKKGEKTIEISKFNILTKSLLPLPEKWHGLQNYEDRYRKRYLDLLFKEDLREIFVKKAIFWQVTREFMNKNGFFEVETPTLEVTTGGAEANPFKTHHNDFDINIYLRISTGELWQKRLIAAAFEKTFEIGRVYRNEGSSSDHLQEFTNMEFYWAYADYEDGMNLTKKLFREIARKVFGTTKFKSKGFEFDLAKEWKKISYREEILSQTKIDVLKSSEAEMKKKLKELNIKYEGESIPRLIDSLWKYCRKNIAGPVFLIDHPKFVSPLAKEKVNSPGLTERFQIIIAGTELGNGYSELNDPIDQKERFKEQQKLLKAGDKEAMMPDWDFVEMLEHGMPPTCGFGFGERLFSVLIDKPMRETTLFPLIKPE
ncbi:lysine--tRNA ligase [Patescibacteria group bacterium]|nr:lysine--tRNA ligase [Patescibacteria group bacterium]